MAKAAQSEVLQAAFEKHASAQEVEHYEISRYGTLKAWAAQLGSEKPYGPALIGVKPA
jgi:ferritin-like metal-binding protein YciE